MTYIILNQSDVAFVNNRAVICSKGDKLVMYDPLPSELAPYFDAYPRHDDVNIDTSIRVVQYDWAQMTASITINDTGWSDPIVFACETTWTEEDCRNAIDNYFNVTTI